jgi:hypothetical protein
MGNMPSMPKGLGARAREQKEQRRQRVQDSPAITAVRERIKALETRTADNGVKQWRDIRRKPYEKRRLIGPEAARVSRASDTVSSARRRERPLTQINIESLLDGKSAESQVKVAESSQKPDPPRTGNSRLEDQDTSTSQTPIFDSQNNAESSIDPQKIPAEQEITGAFLASQWKESLEYRVSKGRENITRKPRGIGARVKEMRERREQEERERQVQEERKRQAEEKRERLQQEQSRVFQKELETWHADKDSIAYAIRSLAASARIPPQNNLRNQNQTIEQQVRP